MQHFTRPARAVAITETNRLLLSRVNSWSHDKVDDLGPKQAQVTWPKGSAEHNLCVQGL